LRGEKEKNKREEEEVVTEKRLDNRFKK